VMLTEAVRVPVAVGVKVTLKVQFAPAATVVPQVSAEIAKSPEFVPVTVRLVTSTASVPGFESVTAWAGLVVPTPWVLNVRLLGTSVTAGPVGLVAVPLKLTDCGLPGALSAMLTEAVSAPVAVGLKVTLMVQLALAATLLPQVFAEIRKSPGFAPERVTLVMLRAKTPMLVSVTD
jgi:hypothetical protein